MRETGKRELQDALLAWARRHGRSLAFRETSDPYRVLVAETMAQQTQVGRVEPAVERFVARFPTLVALADAPAAEVLRAWRGLGYNRRALNLRAAARAIMDEFGGEFPRTLAELQRLPGVGPYTARAIRVHAFAAREAPVDTNVRRVLSRLDPAAGPLQAFADSLVPADAPAAWVNAVMDLAAACCRPSRPRCDACPIATWCASRGSDGADASDGANGADRERPSSRPRAAQARSRPNGPAFPRTTRWLRGRILDRLRDAQSDDWAAFDGPLGDHPHEDVLAMLGVLAREGLLERHGDAATLARLPG